jgi:DNA (cytosine-5)-methyltransferase 1
VSNEIPTHLDLFSGIGGFALAAKWAGFRTVGFCEIDDEANAVTRRWWPAVPNFGDVRKFEGCDSSVDVLTGGVPCQPTSTLGLMRGTSDERWLWPDAIRICGKVRPRFAVFENPAAVLTLESGRAFNRIVCELSALGFDLWWDIISAAALGAGHLRERLIIVAADTGHSTRPTKSECKREEMGRQQFDREFCSRAVAPHTNGARLEGHAGNGDGSGRPETRRPTAPPDLRGRVNNADWWKEINTGIPVLADGISTRLATATHRCIGNAIVPQVAYQILKPIHDLIVDLAVA